MFRFSSVTFSVARRGLSRVSKLLFPYRRSGGESVQNRGGTPYTQNFYSKGTKPPVSASMYLVKQSADNGKLKSEVYDYSKKVVGRKFKSDPNFNLSPIGKVNKQEKLVEVPTCTTAVSENLRAPLGGGGASGGGRVPPPGSQARKVLDKILDVEMARNEKAKGSNSRTVRYSFILLGTSVTCALLYAVLHFGQPNIDTDGEADEYSDHPIALQYLFRAADKVKYYNKLIKEPSRDKLLPDTLKPPYYQPPYTLVLEFTDVLVHPEWTYNTGWRFKKRPGLDQFLEALYSRFEMVVYTAEMGMTVFPIMEALDRNNLISYKLVRDATNFVDGHHVKDLDKLNRDLSKVIVVDWNPESMKMHANNLFKIPRWDGDDTDTTLFDLTAFLMTISEWEIEDVRAVLEHYGEFEDPLDSFKERQKQLMASSK